MNLHCGKLDYNIFCFIKMENSRHNFSFWQLNMNRSAFKHGVRVFLRLQVRKPFFSDISNLISTWNGHSSLSYEVFAKVVDHVKTALDEQKPPKFTEEFDEVLDAMCNEVSSHLDEMDDIVVKLLDIATCICNCEKLVEMGCMAGISPAQLVSEENPIPFYSWKVSQFVKASKCIVAAYQKQVTSIF